jgi:NAD+ synthase
LIHHTVADYEKDMQQLADKLTLWIREQVSGAKRRGTILGLSGGLDSAVVAVLCKRAFPDDTLAVIMPCYSIGTDIEHAHVVANKFGIPTKTVHLEGAFDALICALAENNCEFNASNLAEANLKPRLRMLTLYYLANKLDYLVVGTSNRSELSVGYFTKYGDGGVDIMPLGNLVKHEVRELARYLKVPEAIIEKPPSGGLWEGQTDEGEMGITYEELDHYLTTGETTTIDLKKKIDSMTRGSKHKKVMPQIPMF